MAKKLFQLFAILSLILLSLNTSCNVGSQYHSPPIHSPPTWKNSTTISEASYKDYWWEVFQDPLLNSLQQEVLSKNYDLKIAFNRIDEARGLMNATKAEL